jgi:CheY-like chemotaxis protein
MTTIAIVEDNADNRLLLDAILGERYSLSEYENGQEALDGMRAEPPDLVLMDVSLPGMDGIEVLIRMRADPSLHSIPVVALTAHAMAGDREWCLEAGFDDYVAKPIEDDELLFETVERLVAGGRAHGARRTGARPPGES